MKHGMLYICPTPIGNLDDITIRTVDTFKKVDYIAAEDTRHSGILLKHLKISKPFLAYHEHNKLRAGEKILSLLKEGYDIALVSDAGMPGISDPGSDMIKLCIDNNMEFTVLPGPTASITALVMSGLNTDRFLFRGFLSSKKTDRRKDLEDLKFIKESIIIYESPYRIKDSLKDMLDILGNRQISVSREISKMYEETIRGSIEDLIEHFEQKDPRGEFVLVISGNKEETNLYENISIQDHIKIFLDEGMTKKDAVKKVAKERKISKNIVYKESLDM